jgi:membrane-bound lytic murein transglycosylase MltF
MNKFVLLLPALFLLAACNGDTSPAAQNGVANPAGQAGVIAGTDAPEADRMETADAEPGEHMSLEEMQSRLGVKVLTEAWTGDLDGMVKRRVIRVLAVYGLGRYYLDGPQEKGMTYDMFKAYEASLNEQLKTGPLKVYVIFIPVARDELLTGLVNGRGDIAAAGLTITPERQEIVDFSDPATKELKEVLVTGPSAPAIRTLDDLAGQTVHVRFSSSYHASLQALSAQLQEAGKPAIDIQDISELLEDEDLLEMVNGGLLPWAVVDDYKARIWTQVFDKLVVRDDLVLRSGGRIGYAFRKDSPQLAASLNEFLKTHRQGTLLGNVSINRHLKDFDWAKNALNPEDLQRFQNVDEIFKRYGEQYGFDYLLVAGQGYQESRLDQNLRSNAGAIGIMQLLPSTAADPNVGIADIHDADSNIHAGIKYLDFIRQRYFDDPAISRFNQTLLSFASYNAGPARVQSLRQKAASQGLDPNVWFGNVEIIAAREIGNETVQYVANIYKYYITYRMAAQQGLARAAEREAQGLGATPDNKH